MLCLLEELDVMGCILLLYIGGLCVYDLCTEATEGDGYDALHARRIEGCAFM